VRRYTRTQFSDIAAEITVIAAAAHPLLGIGDDHDEIMVPPAQHPSLHSIGEAMKRSLALVPFLFLVTAGAAYAEEVRDWHDLHRAHVKVQESLKDMERAQAANHYDMGGHAAKAEALLRQAEREMRAAVEFVKHDHDGGREHDRR
jgi:hypothetical protein